MSYFFILPAYLAWHYGEAYRDMVRVFTNILWFLFNFFSIPIMFKTFFAPWQRIIEKKSKPGFHGEEIAEVLMTNLIMRAVGAGVRTIMIVAGLVTLVAFSVGSALFVVAWTILPALIPTSLVFGTTLLL